MEILGAFLITIVTLVCAVLAAVWYFGAIEMLERADRKFSQSSSKKASEDADENHDHD